MKNERKHKAAVSVESDTMEEKYHGEIEISTEREFVSKENE